jgi:hypothetical protein
MKSKSLRDYVEIIATLSVVGGLLLVAWEIRQANGIARAQTVLELNSAYNEVNLVRLENSEIALLTIKMANPDKYEISDVEAAMINSLAFHTYNILWSAQIAHENGILTVEDLETFRSDLENILEWVPRLIPDFVSIYRSQPSKQNAYVFRPIAEKVAEIEAAQPSND